MWKPSHFLMEQASDPAAAGGAAPAAAPAAPEQGSLLSQVAVGETAEAKTAAAAASAAAKDPHNWAPEKYRVFAGEGEAKKLDVEATARKVAEAHSALEKRMGAAGAPPEKPDGYKMEGVNAALKAASGDKTPPSMPESFIKDFGTWAHATGLTQAQFDKALPALLSFIPAMQEQAFDNLMANAQKELVKTWGADGVKADSVPMKAAYAAFNAYAPPALRTTEVMDSIGNNPVVLQILAAVGKELGEDKRLHGEGAEGDNVHALMRTEAYWNKKHAEHASTVRKVNDFFAAGGKAQPKAA